MTWSYGSGWWVWWVLFVIIFFLLPLGYGWGYRGWGPWYRRRRRNPGSAATTPGDETGWGCGGILLWIVLIIAIFWLVTSSWRGGGR